MPVGGFMKLPEIKILDEKDKCLRLISKEVSFPLSKNDLNLIGDVQTYLKMSQIDEYLEKYKLRAGMGLAFVQLGLPKQIFIIVNEEEDNKFKNYVIINPQIISTSEELIYVGEGEGCLSVNRDVPGIVPRHARITIEADDINGNKYTLRVREELAVAFQHEIDHLNGILFIDKIDQKNPNKNKDLMREI